MIKSAEEFVMLRTSEERTCYKRATEEEASPDAWKDIIHQFPEIKKWVAFNKKLPTDIINSLAHDEDHEVRTVLAMRRSLPIQIFELLSIDACEDVRQKLSYNKKVPIDIIERLSKDPSEIVRLAALRRLAS